MSLCACVTKLPRSGWGAGRGVWNRRTASSSHPERRPGVRRVARLVSGSYCSRGRGENRGANAANTVQLLSSLHPVRYKTFLSKRFLKYVMQRVNLRRKNKLWPSNQLRENRELRFFTTLTQFVWLCWYRHWACLLLPLGCSLTELVTWSCTSLLSATQSWQRSWLSSTSRFNWARLSVYLHTHATHTSFDIILSDKIGTKHVFIYTDKKEQANLLKSHYFMS